MAGDKLGVFSTVNRRYAMAEWLHAKPFPAMNRRLPSIVARRRSAAGRVATT